MIVAAALLALALIGLQPLLADWFAAGLGARVLALTALVLAGLIVFAAAAQITGAARLADVRAMLRR